MRSTESVKAVRLLSVLRSTMRGRSSSSQRSPVERDADHPRRVAHVERDLLGRGELGRHDEVALVLPILVVDHHHDLATARSRRWRRRSGRTSRPVGHGTAPSPTGWRRTGWSTSRRSRSPPVDAHRCDPARGRSMVVAPGPSSSGTAVVAADQGGRQVDDVLVDQAGAVERRGRGGAPLHQHLQHAARRRARRARRRASPVSSRHGMDARAGGRLAEHHPQRVATLHVAHGQRRVVGADRAGAHEDGVALGPQAVGVGPGRRAGDPLARAVGCGGAAVERRGQLEHDPRPAGAAVRQVRGQLAADGARLQPRRPPRCPRPGAARRPSPATLGSGSSTPTTTRPTPASRRASAQGGVRPWWLQGSSVVDHRGPAQVGSRGPGRVESDGLGVRSAGRRVAPSKRAPRGDDHGADPGVGRRGGAHAVSQLHRSPHQLRVARCHPSPVPARARRTTAATPVVTGRTSSGCAAAPCYPDSTVGPGLPPGRPRPGGWGSRASPPVGTCTHTPQGGDLVQLWGQRIGRCRCSRKRPPARPGRATRDADGGSVGRCHTECPRKAIAPSGRRLVKGHVEQPPHDQPITAGVAQLPWDPAGVGPATDRDGGFARRAHDRPARRLREQGRTRRRRPSR